MSVWTGSTAFDLTSLHIVGSSCVKVSISQCGEGGFYAAQLCLVAAGDGGRGERGMVHGPTYQPVALVTSQTSETDFPSSTHGLPKDQPEPSEPLSSALFPDRPAHAKTNIFVCLFFAPPTRWPMRAESTGITRTGWMRTRLQYPNYAASYFDTASHIHPRRRSRSSWASSTMSSCPKNPRCKGRTRGRSDRRGAS